MEIDLRTEGTLVVALNADDVARLRFNFDLQKSLGLRHEWLTGGEAKKREPYLHTNTVAAIFSPGDHQVDNRKLAKALRIAFERAGGQLHEHTPVAEILTEGNRATGIRLESGDFHHADIVVLAAGAWSRSIPGLPEIARPPVRPVKGQMAALRMDPGRAAAAPRRMDAQRLPRPPPRRPSGHRRHGRRARLQHRRDGRRCHVVDRGRMAHPARHEELTIDELWVGFRPGSRDDAPILGPSGTDGLVLATGHHRNGILLTPVTADTISHHILTGQTADIIRPFGLDRFTKKAALNRQDPRREQQ